MSKAGAIKAGRAFVEVFADNSKLVAGLRAAQTHLKAFGASTRAMGKYMITAGVAMAAPLTYTAKAYGDFEKSMNLISTTIDDPQKYMDDYAKGIRKLAMDTGQSVGDIANGMNEILQAMIDEAKAMDVLTVATKASIGGFTDVKTAVDGLTSVLNSFGMDASNATHVADVMFQTVLRGKLTFAELAQNIGYVAPMARAAGLSFEDMSASIATMTRQGLSADEATTRLVNILKQAPSKAKNLSELVKKYVGKDLAQIAVDFPEIRAASGISALSGDYEGFLKDLEIMRTTAGDSEQAFRKMAKGILFDFGRAKAMFVDLSIAIGKAFSDPIKKAVDWMKRAYKQTVGWIEKNQGLILSLAKLSLGLIVAGGATVAFGYGISILASTFTVLMISAKAAHLALSLILTVTAAMISPIGAVITLVAALGAVFIYASGAGGKAIDWLVEKFKVLSDETKATFGAIGQALAGGSISAAAKVFWAYLKMEWGTGISALSQLWTGFRDFFIKSAWGAFEGVQAAFEIFGHGLEVAWIETTAFLSGIWTKFATSLVVAWEWASKTLKKGWNELKGAFSDGFDVGAANAMVDKAYEAAVTKAGVEMDSALKKRESERSASRNASKQEHDKAMAGIGSEYNAVDAQLQREAALKAKQTQNELNAARAEWEKAIANANAAGAGGAGGGLDIDGTVNDYISKVKRAISGIDMESMTGGMTSRGTFNAAAIQGLQASSTEERIAKATEKTSENTGKLVRQMSTGGLAFA